jgi:hypothetical protein
MGQSKCFIAKRKKRNWEAPTPTSNELKHEYITIDNIHPQLYHIYTPYNKYPNLVYNGGVSPSWKWWQTILQIEISCNQWEHFGGFFSLFWGRVGLLNFLLFPMCSHDIPLMLSTCSQIPNVVTYITNPKEEITTYIFWDFSMLDSFFWWWANKKWPSQKKINWTLGSPTLINISHNISNKHFY